LILGVFLSLFFCFFVDGLGPWEWVGSGWGGSWGQINMEQIFHGFMVHGFLFNWFLFSLFLKVMLM
jgi:hypothetical protein